MSQEIQLSVPNQGLPQAANSWLTPASSPLGPVGQPQTPLAKMHQHLRGRYALTVIFAGVFALVGLAAGVILPRPAYQSVGIIKIDPIIPTPDLVDKVMPLWQAYVATMVQNFHSERVIRAAMDSPEWKAYRKGPPDAYIAGWSKNLVVKLVPNSFDVTVTYSDDQKDGKTVAPVAVKALINAYVDLYGNEKKHELEEKKIKQEDRLTKIEQKIRECEDSIAANLKNDGDELQRVFDAKFLAHTELQKEYNRLKADLELNEGQYKAALEKMKTTPLQVEDFVRVDPRMQKLDEQRAELESEVNRLLGRLLPTHQAVKDAKSRLEQHEKVMNQYKDELVKQFFIKDRPDGNGRILWSIDMNVQRGEVRRQEELLAAQKLELDDLSTRTHKVGTYRADKVRFEEDRRKVRNTIDSLASEIEMTNNMVVIDSGGQASIGSDKRIAFGAIGFLAGGGIPVGLMLLISLMNPRFRYSDEASGQTATGLTLLGILPDLPDRLSDPEQASIAAHCVHQIRTMLQINNGTDERRVFAITSAAPGDGKTSLTLALGLSYAACGTRTLLIDCDLIGAGLTSRMNIASNDGVLEAIAHRSLLEYVRNTDIADVSILPVGTGQHLHASTLSPAALRRLIEEAKKHFDTILIDTGPVLGSIEASLVAAAADAVVLTVSRGQQRPLVEKTIQHLKNIKSNLAGIVFNRAQTADFDSSISGLSLRSTGGGNGHGTRMGPVARAVQSAFKPAGEDVN